VAGPAGPAGATGATGAAGATGATGPSGVASLTAVTATMASGTRTATATCPAGKRVFGGGVTSTDTKTLVQSGPVGTTGWIASYSSDIAAGKTSIVTAYCG
jgi:collagen type I alpha